MAEIVRRRSWGGVLPLGRHVSISGSRSIHAPSVSIAPSSFQEEQNARHHKQFKLEQALTCGGLGWHGVEQGLDAGQAGRERDARGGDVQTASPVAQQSTPVREPAETALHYPAAREHNEACLSGITLEHTVAHAVPVRPL